MVLLFVLVIEYFQSRFATFTSVKDFSSTPTDPKLPDTFLGNSQERNLVLTEHEIKTAPFKGKIFCVWPWKVFYFETFWNFSVFSLSHLGDGFLVHVLGAVVAVGEQSVSLQGLKGFAGDRRAVVGLQSIRSGSVRLQHADDVLSGLRRHVRV